METRCGLRNAACGCRLRSTVPHPIEEQWVMDGSTNIVDGSANIISHRSTNIIAVCRLRPAFPAVSGVIWLLIRLGSSDARWPVPLYIISGPAVSGDPVPGPPRRQHRCTAECMHHGACRRCCSMHMPETGVGPDSPWSSASGRTTSGQTMISLPGHARSTDDPQGKSSETASTPWNNAADRCAHMKKMQMRAHLSNSCRVRSGWPSRFDPVTAPAVTLALACCSRRPTPTTLVLLAARRGMSKYTWTRTVACSCCSRPEGMQARHWRRTPARWQTYCCRCRAAASFTHLHVHAALLKARQLRGGA